MKTEDLIKYALIAAGAWLVWEYVISPMMTTTTPVTTGATTTTTTTPVTTTSGTTTPVVTTTQPTQVSNTVTPPPVNTAAPLVTALISAAGGSQSLSIDQWAYYYNNMPGKTTITAQQMENMIQAAGLTDASRATPMNPTFFVSLLSGQGLSGIIRIPANVQQMGMGTVRGNFRNRPNAFSGAGGGTGRRQTIH